MNTEENNAKAEKQAVVNGSFLYFVKNTETKSIVGILSSPDKRGFCNGVYVDCGNDEKAVLNGECVMRMEYFANNSKYELSQNCH